MARRLLIMALCISGWMTTPGMVLAEDEAAEVRETFVSEPSWWLPPNAAEHGGKIDGLFLVIFWVTMITMIAVLAVLVYFLFKYRHQPGRKAVFIHGSHKLEVFWTITPAVLLVIMGILSIRVWADVRFSRPDRSVEEVTEVEVLAQQFQWNLRYPGLDGKFGTLDDLGTFDPDDPDQAIRIAEIVVPVDRHVRMILRSKDVLHSFFIPNMRQKLDAVPGLRGELWFKPTKTGLYEVACAELCGPQHYAMKGRIRVLSQEDFDAWWEEEYAEVLEILEYYAEEDEEMEEDAEEEEMEEEEEP